MKNTTRIFSIIAVLIWVTVSAQAMARYQKIIVPDACHPALNSAAQIMAEKLGIPNTNIQALASKTIPENGQLVFAVAPLTDAQKEWIGKADLADDDGYTIAFKDGAALIFGNRPRSFLYAAGDVHLWNNQAEGIYKRQPSFALRTTEHHGNMPMPEYVAAMGMNLLIDRRMKTTVCFKETLPDVYAQLSERNQQRLVRGATGALQRQNSLMKACHDADIDYYVFLYGNNFKLWSNTLYEAVLKAYPSVRGTPPTNSWEQATLCPSDPMTWKLIDAYLREYMAQTKADGLYITYWDNYGIYCQCDRCKANGMDKFENQLYACVKQYHETINSLGKKLIVRTWSSGVPHWLRDQWVHAPGYDHFGGSGMDLWGRVFRELPDDIIIQTKVYHADCQPAPRFTTLLGKAGGHQEIAEYQMTGQTTGRYYFPASTVNHTVWTMKKSHELMGSDAGVNLYLGGTRQSNYFLLDDILNSINVYAWRELSWNVNADMEKIWSDWATRVYGEKAAPHMARAIQLSEDAVNRTFSTLGMGSSTNSDFAKTISRRETLMMYTNRHFLPEYAKYLEPTQENIQRVIDEKDQCLKMIDQMYAEFDKAKPYLTDAQVKEIQTRFDWMKEFAIIKRYLEESLFRFRYLRYLNSMRTTDPAQMQYLAQAFEKVRQHRDNLFRYDPDLKFQCYDTTLGNLQRKPSLGSPISLMKELYDQSKVYVEEIVGPHYLSKMPPQPKGKVAPKPLYRDPVYDGAADPVVIWNHKESKWFMFYTNRRANVSDLPGVSWVHGTPIGIAESSDNGATWTYRGQANIDYGQEPFSYWAPEVLYHDGLYHMYLTFVPGMHNDWSGTRSIVHLTSKNAMDWTYQSTLDLASDRVIDACVFQWSDGTWRMWYNNEKDRKSIYYADSPDLFSWQDKGKVIGDRSGEGPKVFKWKECLWMVVDNWRGLGVYRSEDGQSWTRQEDNLLQSPGKGKDDKVKGGHPDVIVSGDQAFLFYFTHPGRREDAPKDPTSQRRSSIQVVELKYQNGWLTCDRDEPTRIRLTP